METPQDRYIREHSTPQDEALAWIERQTNIRTNYPRMLSGAVQGRFLTMLVEMTRATRVLEIGCFTGYSAACMALGLPSGGHVDTLEINDELEDLTREGWQRAGVDGLITLHIGDALETLKAFADSGRRFDFVYIDANKREYLQYYNLIFDMLDCGGVIVTDDVMLGGKVYEENVPGDKQTRGLVEYNEAIAKDPRIEVVLLPVRDGVSVIRKKDSR